MKSVGLENSENVLACGGGGIGHKAKGREELGAIVVYFIFRRGKQGVLKLLCYTS